jgi:hypothetical protein
VIRGGIRRRRRRYGHEGINWDVSLGRRSNLVRGRVFRQELIVKKARI